jgi:kynurenine formamidase
VTTLTDLVTGLGAGAIEAVDLTAPLSETTPIIALPADHGQPWPFAREPISNFDAAGPTVYWNNIRLSEHTGTHFDAPVHWLSGRDGEDVSQIPPGRLIGPAVVLDFSAAAAADPDFLLTREHVDRWQADHGPLPADGWLLYRTGWDARGDDPEAFLNGGHTPGIESDCAQWLAEKTSLLGLGVETVGTDAGQAGSFAGHPYPCHWHLLGAGRFGLTQLRNLGRLPARGSVVLAAPLPIVGGSGSPARVIALVDRSANGGAA